MLEKNLCKIIFLCYTAYLEINVSSNDSHKFRLNYFSFVLYQKLKVIRYQCCITEVIIQLIITTIVLIIFNTITPTLFLCVICYWIRFNECDNVFIKLFKTITIDLIITIVITTCIGSFIFIQTTKFIFIWQYQWISILPTLDMCLSSNQT